ncbi:MAG: tRNA pseudouridine(38-40) synthase TruA, partial [Deltaproteobacteria bacterium]|nr:tRNA pseudouridine(38-40) synthase TruA [Deltaproteobacteria bacterium]
AAACDADGTRNIPEHGFVAAMNARLSDDVAIRGAEIVRAGYDPRHDAIGKRYRYLVHVGRPRDPLLHGRAWHLDGASIATEAMRDAALPLVGTHDFAAFRAADDERPSSTRTLTRIEIREGALDREDILALEFEGQAFMKHMVRILVGTLVEVGMGRRTASSVAALLSGGRREDAGRTAPAHGLYLVHVELGRAARPGG